MNCRWVGLVLVWGAGVARADGVGSDFRTAPPASSMSAAAGAPRTSPTGRVVQGDGLEDAALSRVVKANKKALEACLDRAAHRDPAAEGRIYVSFEIAPEGTTRDVTAEDAVLRDAKVDACLVDQVKGWLFPRPRDGKPVQVRLPVAVGTQLQALPEGPPACAAEDGRGEPRQPVLAGPEGAPQVEGRVAPEEVRMAVMRVRPRIRACYERALKSDPTLALRLTMGFTVGTDGKVSEVKLDGLTPAAAELGKCLTAAMKAMVFAPRDTTVMVRYPFTFGPALPAPDAGAPAK